LVVLAIGVGSWACKGDPQGNLRGDAVQVIAAPSSLFIDQGETELVLIEVLDDQGNQLGITDFAMTSGSPVVTVLEDSTFNLVFDAEGNAVRPSPWTRARFHVCAGTFVFVPNPTPDDPNAGDQVCMDNITGSTTLTASGGGLTLDIPVRLVPVSLLTGAISPTAPAITETVTITMPPGVLLDPATSTVTFSDGSVPANVVVDPAGTSVSFLAAPNTNAPATVSGVTMTYAPTVPPFSISTEETLTAVAVTSVAVTYSNATPAGGEVVRMTAGAGFLFTPASVVSLLGGEVIQVAIAADSTYIDFAVPASYAQMLPPNVTAVNLTGTPFVTDLPADIFFTSGLGLPGTDDQATAPTITIPASGTTSTFYDSGPFLGNQILGVERIYNFTLAAPTTFDVVADWSNASDVDVIVVDNPVSVGFCGALTGAQPEAFNCAALPAGNYSLSLSLYAGAPPGVVSVTITTP
jgi:hypothetical protein